MPDIPTVHRHKLVQTLCTIGSLAAVTALVGFLLHLVIWEGSTLGLAVLFLMTIFDLALLKSALVRATIVASDTGISTRLFGFTTRSFAWNEINKVKKVRVRGRFGYVSIYYVEPSSVGNPICRVLANLCGSIVFTDDISDVRALLHRINSQAERHKIPRTAWDIGAGAQEMAVAHL